MELITMASFPFLKGAISYIKNNPNEFAKFEEIASDMLYEGVRENAMGRVISALNRGEIPIDFHSPEECREEMLSYILARVLVAATGDKHLIRWYSLAEAVRAQKLLQGATMELILMVAEERGFKLEKVDDGSVEIGFADYLRYATGLKSVEWKLTNQPLKDGLIRLEKKKLVRLVQEALKIKFEKDLTGMKVPDSIKQLFKDQLSEIMGITSKLKESYEAQTMSVVIPDRFPPCIKNLIGMTQAGENVSHSGRFAMTSFLHHIGVKVEEIIELFRVSPDFREDLARYQVEHITGSISGTEYVSMSCKTMVTYGLCVGKDKLCERIGHPLSYYEARNDDALPETERRLRRGLTASAEIAKILKLPFKSVQGMVMKWFKEIAILEPLDAKDLDRTVEIDWEKNLQPLDRFNKAKNDSPVLLRVNAARAWLTGMKVIHPGTMEDIYPVATTGILEDAAGKIVRMMPVLDFESGKILRDFERTGENILISGQFFLFRGRRFLHVIRARV